MGLNDAISGVVDLEALHRLVGAPKDPDEVRDFAGLLDMMAKVARGDSEYGAVQLSPQACRELLDTIDTLRTNVAKGVAAETAACRERDGYLAKLSEVAAARDREQARAPTYSTTVLKAWSGKEVRLIRQTSAIVGLRFRLTLRTWKAAPSPWQASDELAFVKTWHDTMKGSGDVWRLDNTTGAYDPNGPLNATDLWVRFAEDELEFRRMVPGAWSVDFDLITVI